MERDHLYRILMFIPLIVLIAAIVLRISGHISGGLSSTIMALVFAFFVMYISEVYISKNKNEFDSECDPDNCKLMNMSKKELSFRLITWVSVPIIIVGYALFSANIISFTMDMIIKVAVMLMLIILITHMFFKQNQADKIEKKS